MMHEVLHRAILVILLFVSTGYAQNYNVTPNPQAAGYDYFDPDHGSSSTTYRDIVTSAHTEKILGWIQKGMMQDAINDVIYTLDRFANHPKGLQLAVMVATLIKKTSLATYYFERALKIYPQYAITHVQYGAFLMGNGQIDAGIARLNEAVERDPKLGAAYALLAKAYGKKGDLELAAEAVEKARALGFKGEIQLQ